MILARDNLTGGDVRSDGAESNTVNHDRLAGLSWTRIDARDGTSGQHVTSIGVLRHHILIRANLEVRCRKQPRRGRVYREVRRSARLGAVGNRQLQRASRSDVRR
jgi:hypothetical protein